MSSYAPLTRRPVAPLLAAKAKRAQHGRRFGLEPDAQSGFHIHLPPPPKQSVAAGSPAQPVLQAKMHVSEAHDPLEREADRIADLVISGGEPSLLEVLGNADPPVVQRACAECEADEETIQRACSSCAEAGEVDILQPARRSLAPRGAWQVPSQLAGQIEAQRHRGKPLPVAARSFFEARMGSDISDVRIHNDSITLQGRSGGRGEDAGARGIDSVQYALRAVGRMPVARARSRGVDAGHHGDRAVI